MTPIAACSAMTNAAALLVRCAVAADLTASDLACDTLVFHPTAVLAASSVNHGPFSFSVSLVIWMAAAAAASDERGDTQMQCAAAALASASRVAASGQAARCCTLSLAAEATPFTTRMARESFGLPSMVFASAAWLAVARADAGAHTCCRIASRRCPSASQSCCSDRRTGGGAR